MRTFIVGRDPARANVIYPAQATRISRVHARVSDLGQGRFLIEDLSTRHGTSVWRDGGWRRIERAEVAADERIAFGGEESSVRELLARLPGKGPAGGTAGVARPVGGPARVRASWRMPSGLSRTTIAAAVLLGLAVIAGLLVVKLLETTVDMRDGTGAKTPAVSSQDRAEPVAEPVGPQQEKASPRAAAQPPQPR